jgi:hypothetical protein
VLKISIIKRITKMKNKKMAGIVAIVTGILIALIPKVIFPVCTDMIELINGKSLYMKCHWTAMAELLIGGLIAFNGILLVLFNRYETRLALSIMLFLFGLTALLIPTSVIGMCETATMACRVGTEPALIVVSVIIMAVSIGNIISQISYIRLQKLHKERSVIE